MDEINQVAFLCFMRPGVWYCSTAFAGCHEMPDGVAQLRGKMLSSLLAKGLIESRPVFEGFLTKKHRITAVGTEWLNARTSN